jgi:Alr-MurF fusion protein
MMSHYSSAQIQQITQANIMQHSAPDVQITHIAFDTRNIVFPRATLFLALKGKRHNGHEYISDAYAKGVRCFIVTQNTDYQVYNDAIFFIVNDVELAFQQLAAIHRAQFSIPVIGITGSNGKTVVKEWLSQLMGEDFAIVKSPKSYNSQLGVPLSVWQIQAHHTLGIFEAGISQPNEMQRLADVMQPTIGILTNIGNAHDEGFLAKADKKKEKLLLFKNVQILVAKASDLVDISSQDVPNCYVWRYANEAFEADICIQNITQHQSQTTIQIDSPKGILSINLPFTDAASIENAMHCWCVMLFLGYKNSIIQARMLQLQSVALRLELKAAINDCVLINDSYSTDLTSLTLALNFMEQQHGHGKHTVILSDILQSGLLPENLYAQVAELLNIKSIQRVIAIGTDISILKKYLNQNIDCQYFINTGKKPS